MKIKKITSQYRRDFRADYECQSCGFINRDVSGYDDDYFHGEVIPKMKCPKCGMTARDCSEEYRPLTTKYEEGRQI